MSHKTVKDLGLIGFCSTDVPPSPSTTSSETSERRGKLTLGSRLTLVPSTETALEAFRRMCMNRDCGIGVLAPDGTLKHHLSATDLRHLAPGLFHTLLLPVDTFLEQRPLLQEVRQAAATVRPALLRRLVHTPPAASLNKRHCRNSFRAALYSLQYRPEAVGASRLMLRNHAHHTRYAVTVEVRVRRNRANAVQDPDQPAAKRRRGAAPPSKRVLTCQATSTLAEVMAIMASHDVHQVYVVDPDSKPLSAITMADVLQTVVNAAAPATLTAICRDRALDGGFRRGGTPATPNAADGAPRLPALLNESAATSGQSDRAMSVSTSVQSVPQVALPARPLEGSGSLAGPGVEASVVMGTADHPDAEPRGDDTEAERAGE